MDFYVVRAGDTLASISAAFDTPSEFIAEWNGLLPPYGLAVGQCLLILDVAFTHTVLEGETVFSIAGIYGMSVLDLLAANPRLDGGREPLYTGETLIIDYNTPPKRSIKINGYAYPFISDGVLFQTLPYLSYLTPFTYGFTPAGMLVSPDDERLLREAGEYSVEALMHLSTLTENDTFSNELAAELFASEALQSTLIDNTLQNAQSKGYSGIDIDFEYVFPSNAADYAAFIAELRRRANAVGLPVIAALAPKSYAAQPGLLYEGHDYAAIGAAADSVLLMTYEWGYTYGPPMAVAPLPSVRRVVEYALSELPPEKIWLGIPNYGYDWRLPYKRGESRAMSISNEEAPRIAFNRGAEIKYNEASQTPYFNYSLAGEEHEVWFEDARSIYAKLSLLNQYSLAGAGYWNIMRRFAQNWMLTYMLFDR